ncbi:uncharacterized protein LOC133723647 [Rosa rugosa]|uniref:uncharacterized protein LOC133723647 n=1 Tax=Rosa rugosa TaxID=74645 RepID=UPI002B413759|nr:uncharacterized protein LOC133723647 [Rosa rugosa]
MENGVEELELELFVECGLVYQDNYIFPHKLLASPSLKSLKVLHFKNVNVTGEILEHFLSNCPFLEWLTVNASRNLGNFRVVGPSIALKYLVIKYCPQESIQKPNETIRICDTNLVSFTFIGGERDLLLTNVPFLVEVSISEYDLRTELITLVFSQLSCCLSQLQILTLDITPSVSSFFLGPGYEVYNNKNQEFPMLENLKHLVLIVEAGYPWVLHQLAFFMKASPFLERLVLKLPFPTPRFWQRPDQRRKIEKSFKCQHHFLKVVEIIGYRGRADTHVMFITRNAVSLEKIVIDPVRRWLFPRGMDTDRGIKEIAKEVKARAHAMQKLKEKLPSTIEFVCLK